MKAAVLEGAGEPLLIKEVAKPVLSKGEVLVKVKAAAFNRRDWWIQQGQYAGLKFPIVPGSDCSGVLTETFNGQTHPLLHQEVIINPSINWGSSPHHQGPDFKILGLPDDGCFAEYVKVPAENVFAKPAHLSHEEAAALPLAGLTAYRALFTRGRWEAGQKVFVTGAGGGASSFAMLWAIASGAETWVSSGSDEKIQKAISMGARGGVNYTRKNWHQELKEKAGRFDIIIDNALGASFAELPGLCTMGARIVFFGGTAGNIPETNGRPVFWKQLDILGSTMGSPQDFENMLALLNQKQIKPLIDRTFAFEEAGQAMRQLDNRSKSFGKTVLRLEP